MTSWRTRRSLKRPETRRIVQERMGELYAEGHSLRSIAVLFNLSAGTVRTLLAEFGVTLRARGNPTARRAT